jgi:hypothetical protein
MKYSLNGGASFGNILDQTPTRGNMHVAFHPQFDDNSTFFIGDDSCNGPVYRNTVPAWTRWEEMDMMSTPNTSNLGCNAPVLSQYGVQVATNGTLYSAHGCYCYYDDVVTGSENCDDVEECVCVYNDGGVNRQLYPTSGMPKPGMVWNNLDTYKPANAGGVNGICFTLEPWSLKMCGCLSADTDTMLWAIDDESTEWAELSCLDDDSDQDCVCPWTLADPNCECDGGEGCVQGLQGQYGAPDGRGYNPGSLQGMLWYFSDCMAKKGPTLITEDGMMVSCDPVTGRAGQVNLKWEQLCLANSYDIEIAKDEAFTLKVLDYASGVACSGFRPESSLSPAAFIPAGGSLSAIGSGTPELAVATHLECGHTYYWRVGVMSCATGQSIYSPKSEKRTFTVKVGTPVSAPTSGIQVLAPPNGGVGLPIDSPAFSWAPMGETTKYKFQLAADAAMTDIIAEADVSGTGYQYDGTLDYGTSYFWRVMPMEPFPGDWSGTASFRTMEEPPPPPPKDPPAPEPKTPIWVWVLIAIGTVLVIVTLVLIFKTRRV